MALAIFDLDGCISDDRWRSNRLADGLTNGFAYYHEGIPEDKPANIDKVKYHRHNLKHQIVFLTARPEKYREVTEEWLDKHFPFLTDYWLFMRKDGDMASSPEMKSAVVIELLRAHSIAILYDDREDTLEAIRALGVNAQLLLADSPTVQAPYENEISLRLLGMAATARERGKRYGKAYKRFGEVAAALWPDGLTLKTVGDFERMGALVQVLNKLVRYTTTTEGHRDSAHDMAVYATILEEVTDETPRI